MPSVSMVAQLPSRLEQFSLDQDGVKQTEIQREEIATDDMWSRSGQVKNLGGRSSKSICERQGRISKEHGLSRNNSGALQL